MTAIEERPVVSPYQSSFQFLNRHYRDVWNVEVKVIASLLITQDFVQVLILIFFSWVLPISFQLISSLFVTRNKTRVNKVKMSDTTERRWIMWVWWVKHNRNVAISLSISVFPHTTYLWNSWTQFNHIHTRCTIIPPRAIK